MLGFFIAASSARFALQDGDGPGPVSVRDRAEGTGPPRQAGPGRAVGYLAALRSELAARGMTSQIVASGERPRLRVYYQDEPGGSGDPGFDDNVIAAPDAAGRWWYLWPWIDPIGPADDAPGAAEVIKPCDESTGARSSQPGAAASDCGALPLTGNSGAPPGS